MRFVIGASFDTAAVAPSTRVEPNPGGAVRRPPLEPAETSVLHLVRHHRAAPGREGRGAHTTREEGPMMRFDRMRALCGLLFVTLMLPAAAAAQSFKFNKDQGDTARAMAGCWPDGTSNASDTGPGVYAWSLNVSGNHVVARVLNQAAAGNPAVITFSTSGTVVTLGAATGGEGDTGVSVLLSGPSGTISLNVAGPTPGTCPSGTRVSNSSAVLDASSLATVGVAACGSDDFSIEIEAMGDAWASCTAFTNSHADAVWRGQGVYPTIKPRLTVDSSQPGC